MGAGVAFRIGFCFLHPKAVAGSEIPDSRFKIKYAADRTHFTEKMFMHFGYALLCLESFHLVFIR
jgi:hypothetical protein